MARVEPFAVHEEEVAFEGRTERMPGALRWRTLLSADRTPSAAVTLGVAELEPGAVEGSRAHRHAQPEAYYVLAGEGVVRIDGKPFPVRAGSAVFVPGGAVHEAANTGSAPLRILYVFPADAFEDVRYEFGVG